VRTVQGVFKEIALLVVVSNCVIANVEATVSSTRGHCQRGHLSAKLLQRYLAPMLFADGLGPHAPPPC